MTPTRERRARAYAFPLDAFTSHGRPAADASDEDLDADSELSTQQQLETASVSSESRPREEDAVARSCEDGEDRRESSDSESAMVSGEASDASNESIPCAEVEELDEYPSHIQPLIEALAVMRNQRGNE